MFASPFALLIFIHKFSRRRRRAVFVYAFQHVTAEPTPPKSMLINNSVLPCDVTAMFWGASARVSVAPRSLHTHKHRTTAIAHTHVCTAAAHILRCYERQRRRRRRFTTACKQTRYNKPARGPGATVTDSSTSWHRCCCCCCCWSQQFMGALVLCFGSRMFK